MRILVALDTMPYSACAVAEAAKLSTNTWPDITLLGIQSSNVNTAHLSKDTDDYWNGHPLLNALLNYRDDFLSNFRKGESPYPNTIDEPKLIESKSGLWEEQKIFQGNLKELNLRIRTGDPFKEILAETRESEIDLIVMGCSKKMDCLWKDQGSLPEKIVDYSGTSVLIVKENKTPDIIVCCLDHHSITQESIELINQMATLYQTDLEIAGLTDSETLSIEIEQKMQFILDYYTSKDIRAWMRLVDTARIESFISQAAQDGLVALWMGKRSLLEKIFPRKSLSKLVKTAQSSVLVLR